VPGAVEGAVLAPRDRAGQVGVEPAAALGHRVISVIGQPVGVYVQGESTRLRCPIFRSVRDWVRNLYSSQIVSDHG
jgi:hypothetical protein